MDKIGTQLLVIHARLTGCIEELENIMKNIYENGTSEKSHSDSDELEQAHKDYEQRKERLLDNLATLKSNLLADETIPKYWTDWIQAAIDFIKEKEI